MVRKPNVLERWGVTVDELSEAILANGSLRGMVFGYVAEIKLRERLAEEGRLSDIVKDDDHDRKRKGDLRIVYRRHEFKIESKSLQTSKNRRQQDGTFVGVAQVDASDRRSVLLPDGSLVTTTCLVVGEFDVLAVNCFTFENEWHWAFAKNRDLPRSAFKNYSEEQRRHLLATLVPVAWPPTGIFTEDVFRLLDELVDEREEEAGSPEVIVVKEEGEPPVVVQEPPRL